MICLKIHAVAHELHKLRVPVLPWLLKSINRVVFSTVIAPSAQIGHNVVLAYEGLGTVIGKGVALSDGCVIGTNVTLGGRSGMEGNPVIGRGAMIGTGAKVLGRVIVGDGASIGANAVVLENIPPYAVAVGVPAKVVRINRPDDVPDYHNF